jgi:ABC-type multidrug transport system fused ATPase/permease subunit
VEEGLGEKLGLLLQWMATLVAGVIVSLYTEWRLTLLIAFAGLLVAASTALLSVVTTFTTSRTLSLSATASALAEEALAAIATVKAFCAEEEETKRYSEALHGVRRYGRIVGVVRGLSLGEVQLLVFSCYASSLWLGAFLVQEELIQAGEFVTVFFAVLLVGVSVGQALPHLQTLVSANAAGKRLQDIVQRVPLVACSTNEGVWPETGLQPSVEFRNVTFSYPTRPQELVLKSMSVSIAPGEMVAIVGSTGSGKSTMGHLLTRLYDVTQGDVMIGGVDVRQLSMERLREQVGVVSQDPALFQTSIAENIGLGSGDVSPQESIVAAATAANAHDFITKLPQGYKTVVGSRGSQLSGGQRQRVAIARALVRNPKILLLDEATSALDTESERLVQEALDKAREGRTTIIIAHRLSTVRRADTIIVMETGSVAEIGSHDELLKNEGVYYNLVHAQLTEEVGEGEGEGVAEKGMIPQSPRTPTSPVLSAIAEPHQAGEEMEEEKTLSLSWFSVLRLSVPEWPLLVAGVTAAGIQGAVFPSFSIFFGRALEAFTFPFNQVRQQFTSFLISLLTLGSGAHSPVGEALSSPGLCVCSFHGDQECCILAGRRAVDIQTEVPWLLAGSEAPTQLV